MRARHRRKYLVVLTLFVAAAMLYGVVQNQDISVSSSPSVAESSESTIQTLYENRQSDVQVRGQGTVSKILPDDLEGSRHQRFIVELSSGQTLLIAHNIDLAPRVKQLEVGDRVEFYGEYEWNPQGGVVHWTHRDPAGRHAHGWLRHDGKIYQ